jgi:hypothetical protein
MCAQGVTMMSAHGQFPARALIVRCFGPGRTCLRALHPFRRPEQDPQMGWETMNDRTAEKRSYRRRYAPPAGQPGRRKPPRRHSVARLIAAVAAAFLIVAGGAAAPAGALTHTTDAGAATQATLVVSQAGVPRSATDETWEQAWACGLSAGIGKLKSFGPDGEDLENAIEVTLEGKDLAANIRDLIKAAVVFGLDVLPYGACFEPYFFPPPAGGGATPAAPTGLTVHPDSNNGTVLKLTWKEKSDNVLYFDVANGVNERSTIDRSGAETIKYTWTGLKPGSLTCFRVRATNGDTSSKWDPNVTPWHVCARTSSPSPPPPPPGPCTPKIDSVGPFAATATQTVEILGSCFGAGNTSSGADTAYFRISDLTAGWNACWTGDPGTDSVTCNVSSWTNNEITFSGYTGDYGDGSWVVNSGDTIEIQVWNPQSGAGPAIYEVVAGDGCTNSNGCVG